jgi:hypothetical protein
MVDVKKIEKRTIQSFYDDGLTEIALGVILLLLGGGFLAQATAARGSKLEDALTVFFLLVIFGGGFLVNRLLRFFKRRITYPRTGYVTFKKKDPGRSRRTAASVVAMIISASLVVLFRLSPSFRLLYPAVNGLLFAVAALLFANRVGLIRFFALAGASALIGLAVTAAGIGDIKGIGVYYLAFGAAVLVSGLVALVVYLRRNPRSAADGPGGPDAR